MFVTIELLKFLIQQGLEVSMIRKVLQFDQSNFKAVYIDLNNKNTLQGHRLVVLWDQNSRCLQGFTGIKRKQSNKPFSIWWIESKGTIKTLNELNGCIVMETVFFLKPKAYSIAYKGCENSKIKQNAKVMNRTVKTTLREDQSVDDLHFEDTSACSYDDSSRSESSSNDIEC